MCAANRPGLCVGGRRREARPPLPTRSSIPPRSTGIAIVRTSRIPYIGSPDSGYLLRLRGARRPRGGCRGPTRRPSSSPNASSTSSRIRMPGTITGARSGCRPVTARRSRERQRGEPVEQRLERRAASTWPSMRGGVVDLEREVDRRARRRRCRPPRRARARRSAGRHGAAAIAARTSAASAASCAGVGGSSCRWRSPWRTTPTCSRGVEARAATSSVEPPPMSTTSSPVRRCGVGGRAGERERRLLVAAEDRGPRGPSAPQRGGELRARRRRRARPRSSPRARARRPAPRSRARSASTTPSTRSARVRAAAGRRPPGRRRGA